MTELSVDPGRPGGDDTGLAAMATLPMDIPTRVDVARQRAIAITIDSDADYEQAAVVIVELNGMAKTLDTDRTRLKAPFLEGCRRIDEYFRGPIQALGGAVAKVKEAMVAYDQRKRLAAQEAERRQREEREAAEAEARRKAAEAQEAIQRQQQAQAEADAAAAAGDRERAIEARRKALRAQADTAAAVTSMDQAAKAVTETIAAPAPVPAVPKVDGVKRIKVWKYRVVKPLAIPASYLVPDDAKIQAAVDRLKDMAQETLGDWIEVYSEDKLAVGKGRS